MPAAVKPPKKSDLEKALNTLPKTTKNEILKDKGLVKRIGELLTSLKGGADTIRGKLNKSEIEKIIKSESRADIKARVKGTPKPKSKGESRADIKARVKGTPTTKLTEIVVRPKSSVKDVAPLGGSSYKIKSGDTLSAIARRNNTTVAALMRMNPKIENKNEIRTGQFIKVGSPTSAAAKTKSAKSLRGDPTSVAEAKRRGMSYYVVIDSKGKKTKKAAVTAAELKKSGLSLRAYLNKMKKKK